MVIRLMFITAGWKMCVQSSHLVTDTRRYTDERHFLTFFEVSHKMLTMKLYMPAF